MHSATIHAHAQKITKNVNHYVDVFSHLSAIVRTMTHERSIIEMPFLQISDLPEAIQPLVSQDLTKLRKVAYCYA